MPSDWPDDARPQTRVLGGDGTTSVQFTVPAGVVIAVESVVATVANGGSASTPRMVIEDNAGAVITEKRQNTAIPAGTTDRATWALRLADDLNPDSAFLPVLAAFAFRNAGQSINNNVVTRITFTSVPYERGEWIDLGVDATTLTVPTRGLYVVEANVSWGIGTVASTRRYMTINVSGTAPPGITGAIATSEGMSVPSSTFEQNATLNGELPAGAKLSIDVLQASGVALNCGLAQLRATRVWKL